MLKLLQFLTTTDTCLSQISKLHITPVPFQISKECLNP